MNETPKNDLAVWLERMGFNGKQYTAAAKHLGMSGSTLMRKLRSGEITQTDRLAMAALRADLEPWTPENDGQTARVKEMRRLIVDAAAKLDAA